MKNLKGKVAVVTGAGSGIGRETALALAKEGTHLALCDILAKGLEATKEMLLPMGINISTHQVDVARKSQIEQLAQEVSEIHQHIHILVNNAGIASGTLFEDQSLDDFDKVMRVNLYGVVYGCKYFLPYLKKESEAHIVNICSLLGLIGFPVLGAYTTSKFAVCGFSECLWHELKQYNINVTAVFPGFTKTNLLDSAHVDSKIEDQNFFYKFKDMFQKNSVSPKLVAERVLGGIKKNKVNVIVGPDTAVLGLLKRFLPNVAFSIAHRMYQPIIEDKKNLMTTS